MEEDHRLKVDRLEAIINSLKLAIDEMSRRPLPPPDSCQYVSLSTSSSSSPPAVRPPTYSLDGQVKLPSSASLIPDKALFAVVERLPEPTDISINRTCKQSSPADFAFITNVCQSAGISCPVSCFRSPSKNTRNPRVLKVRFESKEQRDTFIDKFRRSVPPGTSPMPSARRDLSPSELDLLHSLRKDVYKMNLEAGKNLFYVRDLCIAKTPAQFVEPIFGRFRTQTTKATDTENFTLLPAEGISFRTMKGMDMLFIERNSINKTLKVKVKEA